MPPQRSAQRGGWARHAARWALDGHATSMLQATRWPEQAGRQAGRQAGTNARTCVHARTHRLCGPARPHTRGVDRPSSVVGARVGRARQAGGDAVHGAAACAGVQPVGGGEGGAGRREVWRMVPREQTHHRMPASGSSTTRNTRHERETTSRWNAFHSKPATQCLAAPLPPPIPASRRPSATSCTHAPLRLLQAAEVHVLGAVVGAALGLLRLAASGAASGCSSPVEGHHAWHAAQEGAGGRR